MAKKRALTDAEIITIVDAKKSSGVGSEEGSSNLTTRREKLFDRYMGEPYGDEMVGQSAANTRECMEAVEWSLPSIVRVFASGDQIGEFIPESPQDEATAEQETKAVNNAFFSLNSGFMTLYNGIKDILMNPVAYSKVYWSEEDKITTERYEALTIPQIERLAAEEGVSLVAQEENPLFVPSPGPMTGPAALIRVPAYDIEIKRKSTAGGVRVELIPGEEVTVDGQFSKVSLEEAAFVCHTSLMTRSDIVAMGFSQKVVDKLSPSGALKDETRRRHDTTDGGTSEDTDRAADKATELIEVDEAYMLLDRDQDGIAERIKVLKSDKTVLEITDQDYMPIVACSAVPLPHTHVGLAWQELVQDLQGITTTITRQLLNNMYRSNNPRTIAGRGANLDDIMNDLPGGVLRTKDVNAIRIEPTHSVVGEVLPALTHLEARTEARIGVSKNTKGVDADTLSRVAKGAYMDASDRSNQRLDLLVRIIAEGFIKPHFLKIHRLLRTHQKGAMMYKTGGQWAEVKPSMWRDRNDMKPLVGLGTGNRQGQLMAINNIIDRQYGALQSGLEGQLVNAQKIYESHAQLVELAQLPNPEKYFINPASLTPQQQQQIQQQKAQGGQDDALAKAQMAMADVERQKADLRHQEEMAKLQVKHATDQQESQRKIQELQAGFQKQSQDFALKRHDLRRKDAELLVNTEIDQARFGLEASQQINEAQRQISDQEGGVG